MTHYSKHGNIISLMKTLVDNGPGWLIGNEYHKRYKRNKRKKSKKLESGYIGKEFNDHREELERLINE